MYLSPFFALRRNQIGELSEITSLFDVPFTGYIDGIKHDDSLDAWAERRRPPISLFHLGQYQQNGTIIDPKGQPSRGDIDVDRSPLGLDHYTIDDSAAVLLLLK
jgi:hypothetical protein